MARTAVRTIVVSSFFPILLVLNSHTLGQSISTAEILSRSVSQECLNWRISGLCLWLKCTFFGCFVVTSPKIAHRIPDFVVSAYPQTGNSPWKENWIYYFSDRKIDEATFVGWQYCGGYNRLNSSRFTSI